MAEILGVGLTHYPPLLGEPDTYANLLRGVRTSHLIPDDLKDPAAWPAEMQEEWRDEHHRAVEHQRRHRDALRVIRDAIDDFDPDAVIIFGDDQYENFRENVIPPFNMYCMDAFESRPFAHMGARGGLNSGKGKKGGKKAGKKGKKAAGKRKGADERQVANLWQVESELAYEVPGAGRLARELANAMITRDCPIAYSYRYLNQDRLSHAFANALVFLDWDRQGWPYPIIPVSVNCYGAGVIHTRGGAAQLFDTRAEVEKDPYLDFPGPAGPTPRSCFNVGRALRGALDGRDGRYVVMASSGWSHAFLTAKHHWLYPDHAFDLARFEELKAGRQESWAQLTTEAIEDAGDQEFKNWICLAGVVPERTPRIIDYLETWIFNSQKCFALFE